MTTREGLAHKVRHGKMGGFLVTLISLGWLLLLPSPAVAQGCPTQVGGFGVISREADIQYGNRVTHNLVVDPSSQCPIGRTIFIKRNSENWVEIGWYEDGWADSVDKCTDTESPHIAVAAMVRNFWKCKPGTSGLTAGEFYSFRVDNPDHDLDFVYYWSSTQTPNISLGFFATDHRSGWAFAQTERNDTDDSLRATYQGANSLGGGGNWDNYRDPWDTFTAGNVSGWRICGAGSSFLSVKAVC